MGRHVWGADEVFVDIDWLNKYAGKDLINPFKKLLLEAVMKVRIHLLLTAFFLGGSLLNATPEEFIKKIDDLNLESEFGPYTMVQGGSGGRSVKIEFERLFGGVQLNLDQNGTVDSIKPLEDKKLTPAMVNDYVTDLLSRNLITADAAWEIFANLSGGGKLKKDSLMLFLNMMSETQKLNDNSKGFRLLENGILEKDLGAELGFTKTDLQECSEKRAAKEPLLDARKLFFRLGDPR